MIRINQKKKKKMDKFFLKILQVVLYSVAGRQDYRAIRCTVHLLYRWTVKVKIIACKQYLGTDLLML